MEKKKGQFFYSKTAGDFIFFFTRNALENFEMGGFFFITPRGKAVKIFFFFFFWKNLKAENVLYANEYVDVS